MLFVSGSVEPSHHRLSCSADIDLDYDALGRLTNMVDGVGTTKFAYTSGGFAESEDGPWSSDTISHVAMC